MDHSLEDIFHVEGQIQQAMAKNDVQALERLLHDEFVFTDHTGTVIGKHDDIAGHASNAIRLTELAFVKAHVQGTFQGTPFAGFYRYLRVWLFHDEHWQVVAGNLSVVA